VFRTLQGVAFMLPAARLVANECCVQYLCRRVRADFRKVSGSGSAQKGIALVQRQRRPQRSTATPITKRCSVRDTAKADGRGHWAVTLHKESGAYLSSTAMVPPAPTCTFYISPTLSNEQVSILWLHDTPPSKRRPFLHWECEHTGRFFQTNLLH
jgi:hypothetical protein